MTMTPILETLLGCFFVLIAPLMLHLGALRGAEFYPDRAAKSDRANAIMFRWIKPAICLNGALLAMGFALWRLADGSLWILPVAVSMPTLAFQVTFLAIAVFQDTLKG